MVYERTQSTSGDVLIITNGPIQANFPVFIGTKTVLYEITDLNFELRDDKTCEINLRQNFDIANLGKDGIYLLKIRAYDQDDEKRENFATLQIPFQVDKLPPIFTSDTFDFFINNPEFSSSQKLFEITAQDGDEDIQTDIGYRLEGDAKKSVLEF